MKAKISHKLCLVILLLMIATLGSCNKESEVCTVVYYINDSTAPITEEVKKGSKVEYFEPEVDGYEFKYWRYEDGTKFEANTSIDKDIMLYAVLELKKDGSVIEYNVYFNLAGGKSSTIVNLTIEENTKITLSSDLTREGYIFKSWLIGKEEYPAGSEYEVTADTTFVANWAQAVNVTFDYDYQGEQDIIAYALNSSIMLPLSVDVNKENYQFAMWFDGNEYYLPGSTYQLTNSDITIKAMYAGSYEVSFALNDGTGIVPDSNNYQSGDSIILPTSEDVSKNQNTLLGWSDGHKTYDPGSTYRVLYSNVVLEAVWSLNASTVTFLDWDGTVLATQSVYWGEDATTPDLDVLNVEEFVGWNRDITNITTDSIVRAVYNYTTLPVSSFIFTLNSDLNSYSVTSSSKLAKDLGNVIYLPHSYNGKLVTGISSFTSGLPSYDQPNGFFQCDFIEEVYIPSTYKTIGSNAFFNCSGLKTVKIANSSCLERIEASAFYTCENLEGFMFPDTVNYLGRSAFGDCIRIKEIDLTDTKIKIIPNTTFSGCESLVNVYFPDVLEEIQISAFSDNYKLQEITFGPNFRILGEAVFTNCSSLTVINFNSPYLTMIDRDNFRACTSLTSITIPEQITDIGSTAFYNCTSLKEVIFTGTAKIMTIGEAAFGRCDALDKFNSSEVGVFIFPDSVIEIGKNAFVYDLGIQQIVFSANSQLETIGDNAFAGHHSIETTNNNDKFMNIVTVSLPKNLSSFGTNVFMNCDKLEEIITDRENQFYKTVNNLLITGDGKKILAYPAASTTAVLTIPDGVESIDGTIFYQHRYLEEITLPTSLKSISEMAFRKCQVLEKVTILEGLEVISDYAFADCPKLMEIAIPASVKVIGKCTFSNCPSLRTVSFAENSQLETLSEEAFCYSFAEGVSINLPSSLKHIVRGAFGFCENLQTVTFGENSQLEQIDADTFYNSGITTITIPKTVKTLGADIFNLCKNLTEVIFEEGSQITVIPSRLFMNSGLTVINLPNTVTTINNHAFAGTNLNEMVIPNSVTEIAQYAFYDCIALSTITFPDNITILQVHTLGGCSSLEVVNLPSNLEVISNFVFNKCTSLQTITIPNKVTMIGMSCFSETTSLESITLLNRIPPILSSISAPTVQTEAIVKTIFNKSSIKNIYVPAEAVVGYQSSWAYYASLIKKIESE